jgi:23S rRNA (uridine2552-2'-O)-methyltransferase
MPKRYIPNDSWSQKAQKEGFRARSVYKLMELDKRFRLLKNGMTVLDLGAAPGSWMQYAVKKIGPKGHMIGIDLQEIAPIAENVKTYVGDITDLDFVSEIIDKEDISIDLILSDLAPSTSGVKDIDQWKSIELSQAVIEIAKKFLSPKGTCVLKILRGGDFDGFVANLKKEWKTVRIAKAKASRDRSKEIYVSVSDHSS